MESLTGLSGWIVPSAGLACAAAVGIGFALYRHTLSCKDARHKLHTKVDELREDMHKQYVAMQGQITALAQQVSELSGYIKAKSGD